MPVRLAVTAGTVADSLPLKGIKAEHLLADKAYDTNEIVAGASARGMNRLPPKSNPQWRPGMPRTPFLTSPSARAISWTKLL